MLLKARQHSLDQCDMVLLTLAVYQDIVKVYDYTHIDHIPEYIIHHILECSGSVGQAERHDQILIMTISRPECCLPFVAFLDPDQIVSGLEVWLGEYLGTANAIPKLIHQGESITI